MILVHHALTLREECHGHILSIGDILNGITVIVLTKTEYGIVGAQVHSTSRLQVVKAFHTILLNPSVNIKKSTKTSSAINSCRTVAQKRFFEANQRESTRQPAEKYKQTIVLLYNNHIETSKALNNVIWSFDALCVQ